MAIRDQMNVPAQRGFRNVVQFRAKAFGRQTLVKEIQKIELKTSEGLVSGRIRDIGPAVEDMLTDLVLLIRETSAQATDVEEAPFLTEFLDFEDRWRIDPLVVPLPIDSAEDIKDELLATPMASKLKDRLLSVLNEAIRRAKES